jgi:hypothetical protein
MFCKLEHVLPESQLKMLIWLFETTKRIWRTFFPFQYEGRTMWAWKGYWSKFLRDTSHCYSPHVRSGYEYLRF